MLPKPGRSFMIGLRLAGCPALPRTLRAIMISSISLLETAWARISWIGCRRKKKKFSHILNVTTKFLVIYTYKIGTYFHQLSWASWVLGTVFCNQGAITQHDNFPQNWVFLDLLVHSQALGSSNNKRCNPVAHSCIIANTQENLN